MENINMLIFIRIRKQHGGEEECSNGLRVSCESRGPTLSKRRVCLRWPEQSDGKLLCPLLGGCFVLGTVCLVNVCYFRHERVVWVCVGQKRADGKEDLGDGQSRGPLFLQYVETDVTVGVDVWVVDFGFKLDLRRLERVVCWEVDGEEEHASGVGRIWGPDDGGLPVEQVVTYWACGAL